MRFGREYGGAALEYILVTTFAAVVTMGALGVIGSAIKAKLDQVTESLEDQGNLNPFDDEL